MRLSCRSLMRKKHIGNRKYLLQKYFHTTTSPTFASVASTITIFLFRWNALKNNSIYVLHICSYMFIIVGSIRPNVFPFFSIEIKSILVLVNVRYVLFSTINILSEVRYYILGLNHRRSKNKISAKMTR